MNLTHCLTCKKELVIGPNATNKRFCSTKCYTAWWLEQDFGAAPQESKVEKQLGPLPNFELDKVRAAWLACAIDGEGCIGIWQQYDKARSGKKYRPVVQIINTSLDFVRVAAAMVGGFVSVDAHPNKKVAHHRVCYRANVNRRAIPKLLVAIGPHLIIKRKQADLVLEFCRAVAASPVHNRAMQPEFERLYQECKALNKRGIK